MSTTIHDLQQTLADGVQGYTKAAENVKDMGLKTLFEGLATERQEMSNELSAFESPAGVEKPTLAGAVHRGWINLMGVLTSGDDGAILAECERGEDHALEVFRGDLDASVPDAARSTIDSISTRILAVHNKVKELRDEARQEQAEV